ncbi:MepB family protein [Prescottella defluvii]|uniref:MepB family protein n=1 Tax=Prescottella defluvii TaxID=1323361 RepID=UPI0009E038F9|nr:MepB family protein [Prescottella defluvii]
MVSDAVHPDVAHVIGLVDGLGWRCSPALAEPDNADYGAAVSDVGRTAIRFRVGKLTPTKVGLFVSVWRRAVGGSTEPFPAEDGVGGLVVTAREGERFGAFAFPAGVLASRGIVSVDGVGGKRGFRVYPLWSATSNPQAKRSQAWQCDWFLDLSDEDAVDLQRAGRFLEVIEKPGAGSSNR